MHAFFEIFVDMQQKRVAKVQNTFCKVNHETEMLMMSSHLVTHRVRDVDAKIKKLKLQ